MTATSPRATAAPPVRPQAGARAPEPEPEPPIVEAEVVLAVDFHGVPSAERPGTHLLRSDVGWVAWFPLSDEGADRAAQDATLDRRARAFLAGAGPLLADGPVLVAATCRAAALGVVLGDLVAAERPAAVTLVLLDPERVDADTVADGLDRAVAVLGHPPEIARALAATLDPASDDVPGMTAALLASAPPLAAEVGEALVAELLGVQLRWVCLLAASAAEHDAGGLGVPPGTSALRPLRPAGADIPLAATGAGPVLRVRRPAAPTPAPSAGGAPTGPAGSPRSPGGD